MTETITLLASIGTFVSAIVALYTIFEIRKQRKSTYKPELFFDDTHFEIEKNPINCDNSFLTFKNSKMHVNFNIQNLGFGVARIIKIKWIFDFHEAFKELTSVLPSGYETFFDYEYCSIKKSNFYESFDITELNSEIIDFLSPKVHNAKQKSVQIPDVIVKTFFYYHFFKDDMFLNLEKEIIYEEFEKLPNVSLLISYKDLNNDKYVKEYNVRITAASVIYNSEIQHSPSFYVKFSEKHTA